MLNDDDMKKIDLRDVQRKKQEAIERLAAIEAERAELEQSISELAIVERHVAQLLSVDLPEPAIAQTQSPHRRKKPSGIPTIYIMTCTIFRERGVHWLEAQELLQAIRVKWWPDAKNDDVGPTLWRLAKMGKLIKSGTRYSLPAGVRGPVKQLGEPGEEVRVQ